jgi:hypothetical protein
MSKWKPIYGTRYQKKYPQRYMLKSARTRAKKKDIEFNITEEDIIIPTYCPILGIKLRDSLGKGTPGGVDSSPSLDRINPNKGYIVGNVQVLSHKANMMKSNATAEELHAFADWIKENIR